jgi:hypothetical protein
MRHDEENDRRDVARKEPGCIGAMTLYKRTSFFGRHSKQVSKAFVSESLVGFHQCHQVGESVHLHSALSHDMSLSQ